MNQSQPLHTNNSKKIVFVFSVFASMFFNILLFSSIGETAAIRTVWGVIGVAAVFFQTFELRTFYNTKKRKKYMHLSFYIICTIGSITGTLGAGYAHIEKTKLNNIDTQYQIELINKKINDFKKTENDNTGNAINSVLQSTNLNQWAVIRLIKEKKELKNNDFKKYETIEKLKNKKAELLKSQSGIISSLSGLSKMLNMHESKVSLFFLFFVAIILEMMVFGSSTFNGKLINRKKKPKQKKVISKNKKNKDQFFFKFIA